MKQTKSIVTLCLALCILVSAVSIIPMTTFASSGDPTNAIGDGDAVWDGKSTDTSWLDEDTYDTTDVFYISSAAQLASLASYTGDKDGKNVVHSFQGKTIYLTKDIYLNNVTNIVSDSEFTLETHSDNRNTPYSWLNFMSHGFNGTFDGQGHSVYGLYIRYANQNTGAGLFGRLVNSNATIKNVNVKYCDIENGGAGAGGIVGQMYRGSKTIENCHVIGKITAKTHAGGIFGQSPWDGQNDWSGTISNCSVRGTITATEGGTSSGAGGITSYVNVNSGSATALFRNCYVYADITAANGTASVGGIIGYVTGKNATTVGIENCGTSGKITVGASATTAGGLIGYAELDSHFNIVGSYSAVTFDVTGATTPYGQVFGTIDWVYENSGVGGRTDPSNAALDLTGTYYLTAESDTASAAIGTILDEDHIFTSTATSVTMDELTSRGATSLLVRLNEWVASNPTAEMWHIGHHGYPVHVNLPANADTTLKLNELADVITVGTLRGAEVKLVDKTETVLRFTAAVKDSYISTLRTRHTVSSAPPTIEVGTLLADASDLESYKVTPSASYLLQNPLIEYKTVTYGYAATNADTETATHYWTALTDAIALSDIATAYSAMSYIKVTDANSTVTYYDAPHNTEYHVRSALDVTRMAYADRNTGGETIYSASKFAVMKAYLDNAVYISDTEAATTVVTDHGEYYANPYTVEKKTSGELVLTASHLTADSDLYLVVNGVLFTDKGEYPNASFVYEAGKVTVTMTPYADDVVSVDLLPTRVEAWQDLGLDLTLKNTITRTNTEATDIPTLIWSSSNPSVASVNENGSLTLNSAGVTYVVATTPDGVVSNTVVVTVTAPINRAADQQLSLPATGTSRIDIAEYLALPTDGYGDAQIAMWYGNATGACSITIDDSKVGDFDAWNTASNNYDLPVTFIVPTHASGYHAHHWRKQIENGQDVQSHSLLHGTGEQINAMSTAEVWMDYYDSIAPIYDVTGQAVEVLGYSFGVGLEDYAGALFISARGTHGTPNTGDKTNYRFLNSSSRGFTNDITMLVKDLKQVFTAGNEFYGGWYSYHLHGLAHNFAAYTEADGTQINTTTDWLNRWFGYYLQPMRDNGDLWCDTYRNVAKYGQERDTATLSVTQNGDNGFSVSIHDLMDDTVFTQALTVKIMVDATWTGVTATDAQGNNIFAEIVTEEEGTFVFVDVVPDTGVVTVNAVK